MQQRDKYCQKTVNKAYACYKCHYSSKEYCSANTYKFICSPSEQFSKTFLSAPEQRIKKIVLT
jgi:hypothetical protein